MTNGTVIHLEADSTKSKANHQIMELNNAANRKSVLLLSGEHLSLIFCMRIASMVEISDIRYSNANGTDTVTVQLNDETIATFNTNHSIDSDWNNFMSTGRLLARSYLDIGSNILHIHLNATDGLTIDYIDIDVDDKLITQEIAMCEVTCIKDFNPNWQHTVVSEGLSFAMQKSYNTKCSEISNVNIPIYDRFVKTYEIIAVMPQYKSLSNPRYENTSECYHLSRFLWTFKDINLSNVTSETIQTDKATANISKGVNSSAKSFITIHLTFNVEGRGKGMTDIDRGSVLRIQFNGVPEQTTIQMQYKGRAGISSMEERILDPHGATTSWEIPDFTWTDANLNSICLYINSSSYLNLSIVTLYLARRPLLSDKVVGVYKDDDVIVEAVNVDLWWLTPNAMQLILSNGRIYSNVSYFRIYKPAIWNDGYAQVFVMYHDGNVRLLPIPPEGVDWIPFGSSVIIGQAKPYDVRPYSAITSVSLDIETLRMDVMYADGGSAKLELQNNLVETRLIVSNIFFGTNINYPFITFRSMYVSIGNCDVDHVRVNGANPTHIMDDFGFLMGRSFIFYRKCTSKHLNLSPDIYINIKRSKTK
ncbi:hypothetical protein ACJMK2_031318 [Sinanodonta woodiana]|uniref:Uncharacterized protein n=1 Tax=Sinanodonta woodiana TaxID=1069815 RepID=A0ABD3X054_SINWO